MRKVFVVTVFLSVLAVPLLVSAHANPWDPAALRGPLLTCGGAVRCDWDQLWHTIAHIIVFGLALLFYGIAPILFIWGGIKILTSGSSPEGMSEGKRIITGTLMAILIALLSYWIVKFVVTTVAPGEAGRMGL